MPAPAPSTTPTPTCSRPTASTRPTPTRRCANGSPPSTPAARGRDLAASIERLRDAHHTDERAGETAGQVLLHKNLDALGAFDRPRPGHRARPARVPEPAHLHDDIPPHAPVPRPWRRRGAVRGRDPGPQPRHRRLLLRRRPAAAGVRGCRSHRRTQAVTLGREAIELGAAALMIPSQCPRRQGPTHIGYDPLWAAAQEAGIPIVFHVGGGRRMEDDVQGERPAAGPRLPRRRRQLHVGVVHGDPRGADADARHDDLRRHPRPLPHAARRRHRAGRAVAARLDAGDGFRGRRVHQERASACSR